MPRCCAPPHSDKSLLLTMPETVTPCDELLELAEALADEKDRLARLESEHATQTAALNASAETVRALAAGLSALNAHHMQGRVTALEARLAAMEATR
jgi:hypothetical protein